MHTQMVGASSPWSNRQWDKLTEWLAQPTVPTEDLLRWWLANQKLYPHHSQMAIDVHVAPGKFIHIVFLVCYWCELATAIEVERSFSHGQILINHLRNRLHAPSIQALMCLGDWCCHQLVSNVDLVGALHFNMAPAERKKGSKGKKKEKDR